MRTREWKPTVTIWVFVLTAIASQQAQAFPCSSSILCKLHPPATRSIIGSHPLVIRFQTRNDNSNNDDSSSTDTSAKVRFTGSSSSSSSITGITTTNAFDAALSFISSDIVSIALGLLGICLLLTERLTLPEASTMGADEYQYAQKLSDETRSNLIAVMACGSVLLNGLSKLDVTSALAEAVELEGTILQEPLYFMYDNEQEQDANESVLRPFRQHKDTLDWAMQSFLQATPAKTVVILQATNNAGSANDQDKNRNSKWNIVSMAGTVPVEATVRRPELLPSTPILDRFQKDGSNRETYLPTLQALPGKTEFTYIPANTQEVLILSVPPTPTPTAAAATTTAVILGSHRAKSFTPRDVAWCQTLAARMGSVLYGQ